MALTQKKNTLNSQQEVLDALAALQRGAGGNCLLNSGGLAIKAGSSALAKTVNTIKAIVEGVLVTKAAGDMAALSGTIANGSKNVAVFTLAADGTLATRMGTAATTLAGIVFPTVPDTETIIGFLIIENGTGSTFTGGTTALDTGSLTVTYVDTPFPFWPKAWAI